MIHVSSEFREQMEMRTDFKEQAEVTFLDGTKLSLTEDDFTVSNNSITDGAGSNGLPLGAAIQRQVQVELMNDDEHLEKYDFVGAKIRLYLTFQLSKSIEKIEYGYFTVTKPETYGQTVIVTAADDMYRADKEFYSDLAFPVSASTLFIEMCEHCGIQPGNTSFRNCNFIIQEKPSGSNLTFRRVFGYLAMLAAGNARISRQGTLEVLSYDFSTFTQENAQLQELRNFDSLKIGTEDVVITGIRMKVKGKTSEEDQTFLCGQEGYILEIDNPLATGQEQLLVDSIGQRLVGVHLRDFSGDHIAYPLAEFMDHVYIEDRKGRKYQTVLTDISFTFFGITTLKNSAVSAIRNSSKYTSEASKTYEEVKKLVTEERKARDTAIENLAKRLESSSGMYCIKDKQPDGSVIYYMHDKPELSDSMIVWKITVEAIGISTDGGKTYLYGVDTSGKAILDKLYANGIDADCVKIGKETVSQIISDMKKSVKKQGSSLTTMENQIKEKVWKEDITTEIKKISVGARNLARGQSREWQSFQPATGINQCHSFLKSGTTANIDTSASAGLSVTCTVELRWEKCASQSGQTMKVWAQGSQDDAWTSSNPFCYELFSFAPTASGQQIFKTTATWDGKAHRYDIGMRCDYSDGNGIFYWRCLKAEIGNVATDWTPAPEDIDGAVDQAQSTADQAQSTVTTVTTQVESLKTATESLSKAMQSYVKEDDLETYKKQVESQLSQTPDAIEARFKTIEQNVSKVGSSSDDKWAQLETYIRLTQNGIALGKSDSPITLEIRNDRICFMQSGQVVAYYTNNQLYNSNLVVTTTANILGLVITKSGRHLRIS